MIPVLIDPEAESLEELDPAALVDGRMRKQPNDLGIGAAPMVIGLGPGFVAGEDCHAVVETNRGHRMGRVCGKARQRPIRDSRRPSEVTRRDASCALRSDGVVEGLVEIGDPVREGQLMARVAGAAVHAPFAGVLRGLLHRELRFPPARRSAMSIHAGSGLLLGDLGQVAGGGGRRSRSAADARRDLRRRLGERSGAAG